MAVRHLRRGSAALAGGVGLALALAACGGGSDEAGSGGGGDADCAAYEEYGTFDGEEISVYSPIRDAEADLLEEAWADFSECTGIEIDYEGSGEFEAQLNVRVEGGNAPDIAIFPQPGLLQRFVESGDVVPASDAVEANVDEGWSEEWKAYGTVDGEFYAAPFLANVKSFVWYSPSAFEEAGYEVPETYDDLIALSDQIAEDNADDPLVKPWCAGIESGDATGWVATDWMEDIVLRTAGPEVYDQWVNHEIPFDDPQIVEAAETVGNILKNPEYVNGGLGDVQSITTTSFQDAGLPILDGQCFLHRQASFYAAQWPEGTEVAEDGDVFAFYFPAVDPSQGEPLLGGGEFVGAFNDSEAVQAFQQYVSTSDFANARVSLGGAISANRGLDPENAQTPIERLAVDLLQDENSVFRFDASDLMPAAVGAGSFWQGMTEWINGAETEPVLGQIEASWPAS